MQSLCFCRILFVVMLLLVVAGCGGSNATSPTVSLTEVRDFGRGYVEFSAEKGASPGKLEDLESRKATFSKLYDQVKSGDFIVVWNAALTKNGNENDKLVIAYEKKAADQGGVVLFGGGSVRQVTAAEFKAETIATAATAGTSATTPGSEYSAWKETVSKEGGFVISTPAALGLK